MYLYKQIYASYLFEQRNNEDWEDLNEDNTYNNTTNTFQTLVKKQRKYDRNKRDMTTK